MRTLNASIYSLIVVAGLAGCGGGTTPPVLHLDAGNNNKGDMATSSSVDMSQVAGPDMSKPMMNLCDLIAQDCTDANMKKCAAVDDGSGMGTLTTMCVSPTGTKMTGDPCTRINEMPSGEGFDDCAAGNYCSGQGTLSDPPVRHCRSFCGADGDCKTPNTQCLGSFLVQPPVGLCVPTCTPFGQDCGQLNCSSFYNDIDMATFFFGCRQIGKVAAGANCDQTKVADCVADTVCLAPTMGAQTICVPICDMNAHACTNNKTCTPLTMGSMLGLCL